MDKTIQQKAMDARSPTSDEVTDISPRKKSPDLNHCDDGYLVCGQTGRRMKVVGPWWSKQQLPE